MDPTPKRIQRLMALAEVRVVRRTASGDVDLPVGTRGDFWRRVLPEVRAGRLVVQERRDDDGISLVFLEHEQQG